MTIFGLSAAISAVIRCFELLCCTDSRGFIPRDKSEAAFFLLLICAILLTTPIVAGCFLRRCPQKAPKPGALLCGSSFILGSWILYESLTVASPAAIPSWQPFLMNVFGVISAGIFLTYAIAPIFKKQLPGMLFIIPIIFMMVRLIWVYTALNSLALTVEHIFLLLACGATLVFLLQLAKLFCGLGGKMHFKRIMLSGICAVILNIDYALPNLLLELGDIRSLSGESISSEILLLLFAVFIICFLASYFSISNLTVKRHSSYRTNNSYSKSTDFYIGKNG